MVWKGFSLTERVVVGVVGMPGSGKSIVDNVAGKLGFLVVVMGNVVREETSQRGIEPTPENVGRIMLQFREEGPAVVAKKCIAKIVGTNTHHVLIEGIRSFDEVQEFRRAFPDFRLLAIHSSPGTRFKRLLKRRRSDDSTSCETFTARDFRELYVGIGSAIALADRVVVNEGSIALFRAEVRQYLKGVLNE